MAGVKTEEGASVGASNDTDKKTTEDVIKFRILGKRRKRQACRLPSEKSLRAVRVPFSSTQEVLGKDQVCSKDTRKEEHTTKSGMEKVGRGTEGCGKRMMNTRDEERIASEEVDVKGDYEEDDAMNAVEQI